MIVEPQIWTDEVFMAVPESDGCRFARVVHPDEPWMWAYDRPQSNCGLKAMDWLNQETVPPGFSLPAIELFAELGF
ncbi:MAG: hypothetical protein KME16_01370 [Scytolyngbya sp. HA4215-MV1]|nr:hypothetical protein [Scytolyngbya sp. HA4215-MV1]